MIYVEIAESSGKGRLTSHRVERRRYRTVFVAFSKSVVAQTLTEQEAKEWHDIHGGWVAI